MEEIILQRLKLELEPIALIPISRPTSMGNANHNILSIIKITITLTNSHNN